MLETFKRRNFIHRTAEKRREISRCAAKQRREKESDVFTELYTTVPIVEEPKVSHVDRIAVLRLAASFCRFRQVADKVLNPPRISLLDEYSETSFLAEMLGGESKSVDVLSGFLLVVDSQSSIIYISPNVSRSLGLTQTDLIGHNLFEFVKDEDVGEMRATFGRAQLDSTPNRIFIRMKSVLGARGRNLNLRSALYKTMALTVTKHHVDTSMRNCNVNCHKRSSKAARQGGQAQGQGQGQPPQSHHSQHKSLIHHLINKASPAPPGSPFNGSNSSDRGGQQGQGHGSSDVDLDIDVKELEGSGSGSAPSVTGTMDDDRATSTSSNGSASEAVTAVGHAQSDARRPSSVGGGPSGLTSTTSGLTPTITHSHRSSGRRSTMTSRDGDYYFIHGSVINQYGNIETQNSHAFVTRHSMDMKFSYCHERLSDYLGYDIKSLMGLSFYSMIHPQDLVQLKADFKELYQKHQVCTGVYRLMAKSGGYIWLTTEASVVTQGTRSGRGQHIVCIHQVVSSPVNNEILADVQQHLGTLLCQVQQKQQQGQSMVVTGAGGGGGGLVTLSATAVRPDYNKHAAFMGGGNGLFDPPPIHLTNGHSYNAIVTNAIATSDRLLDRAPLVAAAASGGADVGNLPFWDTDDTSMYNYDCWLFRDSSSNGIVKSSSPTTPHTPNSTTSPNNSNSDTTSSSIFSMDGNNDIARSGIKRGSAPTFSFGCNGAPPAAEKLVQDVHEQEGAQSSVAKLARCQQRGGRDGTGGNIVINDVIGNGPIGGGHGPRNGIGRTSAYGGLGFSPSANDVKAASAIIGAADAPAAPAGATDTNAAGGHHQQQQQQVGFAGASSKSMSAVVSADRVGSAGAQVNPNGNLYPVVSDAGFSIAKDLTDKLDDLTLLAPFVDTGELVTLDLVPSDLDFPLDFGDFRSRRWRRKSLSCCSEEEEAVTGQQNFSKKSINTSDITTHYNYANLRLFHQNRPLNFKESDPLLISKDLTNDIFSLDKKAKPIFSSSSSTNHSSKRCRTTSTNQNNTPPNFITGTPPSIGGDGYWMFNAAAGGHVTSSGPGLMNPDKMIEGLLPPPAPPTFYETYAGAVNQSYWPPSITCPLMSSAHDDVIASANQNQASSLSSILGTTPNNNSLPQAHPDFFNAASLLSLGAGSYKNNNSDLSIFEHQSPTKLAQSTIDTVLSSSLPECKPIVKYCNTDTTSAVESSPTNQMKASPPPPSFCSHVTANPIGSTVITTTSDLIGRPASCAAIGAANSHVTSSCNGGGSSGTSTPIGRSIVEEAGHGYARQLTNDDGTPAASFLFNNNSQYGDSTNQQQQQLTRSTNTPFITSVFSQSASAMASATPSSCNLWPIGGNGNGNGQQQSSCIVRSAAANQRKRPAPAGSAHHRIRYKEPTLPGVKKQHVQFAYQTGGTTVIGRKLNTPIGGITATNSIYPSCYQGGTNVVIKRSSIDGSATGIRASPGMTANGGHFFNGSSFLKPMSTTVVTHNGITASSSNPPIFKRYHQQQPQPIGTGLYADSSNWNQPIGGGINHYSGATPFHHANNQSSQPTHHQIIVAATEPTNTKIRYVRATYNTTAHHHHQNLHNHNNNENSQPPVLQSLAPSTTTNLIGGGVAKQQPPLLPLAIC